MMLGFCITTTISVYVWDAKATDLGVSPLAFSMCGNIAAGKDAACLSDNTGGHAAIILLEYCIVFVFKSVPLVTVNGKNSNKELSQGFTYFTTLFYLCHTL